MPSQSTVLRWCAVFASVLGLAACTQRPGPDDWYRVDPLFTNAARDTIGRDGSLNPYKFRFEDQPTVPPTVNDAMISSLKTQRVSAETERTKLANNQLAAASQQALLLAFDAEIARRSFTTAYAAALANVDNRNRYIALLISQSDAIVGGHLASIIGTQNALELSMGTTALVTSALATAFTPPGTKTALSAASAIASGTRTSVRETVYSNAFGWAIAQSIIEDRTKFLKDTILTKAQTLDARTYTIDHAIADIQNYHERGSFYNGLIEINKRIAAGDRRGVMPTADPTPKVEAVGKDLVTSVDKPEVTLALKLEKVGTKTFLIVFNDVKSVELVNTPDPLVVLEEKTEKPTFEVRLSGTTSFKVVPKFKNDKVKTEGFKPIIVDVGRPTLARHAFPVSIPNPPVTPTSTPTPPPAP